MSDEGKVAVTVTVIVENQKDVQQVVQAFSEVLAELAYDGLRVSIDLNTIEEE